MTTPPHLSFFKISKFDTSYHYLLILMHLLCMIQQKIHVYISKIFSTLINNFHAIANSNILRSDMFIPDYRIYAICIKD